MKVFTYHTPIPSLNMLDEVRLVDLWYKNWKSKGYTPHVLNEYWAKRHPLYEPLTAAAKAWPTSNPREYEFACFHRWLAVAQYSIEHKVSTNVLMVDTDVFTYGGFSLNKLSRLTCLHIHHTPAAVIGKPEHFTSQAERFLSYQPKPGDTQVSDMTIFVEDQANHDEMIVCKPWSEDGWDKLPLVHYAAFVMGPAEKQPKYKHIPSLR